MNNGFTVHVPAAVSAWLQQEHRDVSEVEAVGIESEVRVKTQEETNYSHFRTYAHTGLHTITLTLRDGTVLQKVFTSSELQGDEASHS
jgi:hypothetical protein